MAPSWALPPHLEDDWWLFTVWPQWYSYLVRVVGTLADWPRSLVPLVLDRRHLSNQERFTVTVFLLANGVPPDAVRHYFRFRFNFDVEAWRQITWVINNYPGSQWRAWHVGERRSI